MGERVCYLVCFAAIVLMGLWLVLHFLLHL
jgi:hypothetical protein